MIEPGERAMIAGVMRLGDRPVRAVMTPRRDVDMVIDPTPQPLPPGPEGEPPPPLPGPESSFGGLDSVLSVFSGLF